MMRICPCFGALRISCLLIEDRTKRVNLLTLMVRGFLVHLLHYVFVVLVEDLCVEIVDTSFILLVYIWN